MKRPDGFDEPEYLDWIRRLPCCVCFPWVVRNPWAHLAPPTVKISDPHHLPHTDKAFGRRVADVFICPLCRGLGTKQHHELADGKGPTEVVIEGVVNLWCSAAVLRWHYQNPPAAQVAL